MNITTCPPDSGGISPTAQRTIRRALTLLERQLREPGEAFTSSHAVRDWLRLQLATLEREVIMVLLSSCKGCYACWIVKPFPITDIMWKRKYTKIIIALNGSYKREADLQIRTGSID